VGTDSPYEIWPRPMPSDLVSVDIGGVLYTDVYNPEPVVYRRLSWWQKVLRWLTPPRWRKSLLVRNDPLARCQRMTADILKAVEGLQK